MIQYIIRRLLQMIPILIGVTILIFLLFTFFGKIQLGLLLALMRRQQRLLHFVRSGVSINLFGFSICSFGVRF